MPQFRKNHNSTLILGERERERVMERKKKNIKEKNEILEPYQDSDYDTLGTIKKNLMR